MRHSNPNATRQLVPLRRYWCSRTGRISFDQWGFVSDPETFLGSASNPDLKTFDEINSFRCLILLGEAGIGKSAAIDLLRPTIHSELDASGDRLIFVDLSQYGNEGRLVKEVFQSDELRTWKESSSELHLVLDSFDECHNLIPALPQIMKTQIAELPDPCLQRFRLRVVCRTGSWPSSLEPFLFQCFGDDQVGIFELVPLRQADVELMAEDIGVDRVAFIREVIDVGAAPFAIKPLTLQFLLGSYQQGETLPSDLALLYAEGCLRLCNEPSRREDNRVAGELTGRQRVDVSCWMSAALLLSNKIAFSMEHSTSSEHLDVDELLIENGVPQHSNLALTRGLIRECIQTGLFTSRGVNLFGPAHLSYFEYLAADCLRRSSNAKRILRLLIHPDDQLRRIAPNFEGVASWLAGMLEPVFEHILHSDPLLLLRGDLTKIDARSKEKLIDRLLELLLEGTTLPHEFDDRELRQLKFQGLDEKLKELIVDSQRQQACRDFAIRTAGACQLHELAPYLRDVAINPAETEPVRLSAVLALHRIDAQQDIAALRNCLEQPLDDPEDELKGALLTVLWPRHLSLSELLGYLTMPKRRNLVGLYSLFLRRLFSDGLDRARLPIALDWVASQPPDHHRSSPFREAENRVMTYAWQALDDPHIVSSLSKTLVGRFKNHVHEVLPVDDEGAIVQQDPVRRHLMIEALIPYLAHEGIEPYVLTISYPPLVTEEDLPWLLGILQEFTSPPGMEIVCKFIEFTFRQASLDSLELVLPHVKRHPMLAEHLRPHIGPIELDSTLAQDWKHSHSLQQQWGAKAIVRDQNKRDVLGETRQAIRDIVQGDLDKWWVLTQRMIDSSAHSFEENWRQPDLRKLGVWNELNPKEQESIRTAARSYLMEREDDPDQWLVKRIGYFPSIAGYKALYLLYSEDRIFIRSLSTERWEAWAPIIVAYPTDSSIGDDETRRALVSLAYKHAPATALQTLRRSILIEDDESGLMLTAELFSDTVDERIESLFLELIRTRQVSLKSGKSLLTILLKCERQDALEYLRASLSLPDEPSEEEIQLAVNAAVLLAKHRVDADWPSIRKVLQAHAEIGKQIVCRLASEYEMLHSAIPPKLTESQLAELYVQLLEWYPPEEDPQFDEFHQYTIREQLARFRSSVIQELKARGTKEGCRQLTKIAQSNPHRPWLARVAEDSLRLALARTPHSVMPSELASFLRDDRMKFVRSGDELMEVVLEALDSIQDRLHGHVPDIQFLWNHYGDKSWHPKEEEAVSDWLRNRLDEQLRQRGIILNREVQVHRRGKTDVHVDAVVRRGGTAINDRTTLVIEVKGCGNDDLDKAMKTQLVEKYLIDSECRHGIYLVAWFNCSAWEDRRHPSRVKRGVDEVREQFRLEAESHSKDGLRIAAYVLDARLQKHGD